MNILQVQDRLKDLSDQQLMREMQSPTGGAPQYLVLTELQRRKKMRDASQQEQAPQSSMAEEAVAGIASLAPPEEPAPQEEMPPQGMYGGGVVRMQEGGPIARPDPEEAMQSALREYRELSIRSPMSLGNPGYVQDLARGHGVDYDAMLSRLGGNRRAPVEDGVVRMQAGGSTDPAAVQRRLQDQVLEAELEAIARRQEAQTARAPLIANAMGDVRALIDSGMSDEAAIQETLRSTAFRGRVTRDDLAPAFNTRRSTVPVGSRPFTEETPLALAPPPIFVPDAEARPDSLVPQGQQISPAPIGTNPPTARPTGTATASGTAAAGGASAAAAGIGSLPQSRGYAEILDEIERRGSGSRLDDLAAQLQRTDPEARRSEATNMALIEAGLRVAGSQSPHFATAVAEAAPALQGYSRALGDIRKDQRDDILTQIQMERARAEDARSARALAANLYGTETQRDLAVMRERGDAGRHAARMASDQEYRTQSLVPQDIRTFRGMVGADYDDNNPRHREIMSQIQTRGGSERAPESVRLAEWINSAPDEAERRRRMEATGRDPALREAQLSETQRRNTEVALNNFAQRHPTFVPNLPQERIQAMRPALREQYLAQQAEYDRIRNGVSDPLGIRR